MFRRLRHCMSAAKQCWLRYFIAVHHGVPMRAHRMRPTGFKGWVHPDALDEAVPGIIRRDYADLLELNLALFEASRANDPLTHQRALRDIREHLRARGAEV